MHLRIGSRGSQLALWQANHIAVNVRAMGHTTEIVIIKTTGDRMQDPAFAARVMDVDGNLPAEMDAKGIFIKEIEEALDASQIDLAVHSLKDLPTILDARFALAAIPERADARDALLCPEWLQLHTLPAGARIGTTSPRRIAQLRAHNPEFQFVAIRGNIDTRLRKLARGECDALVLACAGLDRLGTRLLRPVDLHPEHPEQNRPTHMECVTHPDHDHLEEHAHAVDVPGQADWIRERFDPDTLCPAPGQGALGIEVRADDSATIAALQSLDHAATRYAVEAERWLLHALGGGCSLPVGALCVADGYGRITLQAAVTSPDGDAMVTVKLVAERGETARELGSRGAQSLVEQGARELLAGDYASLVQ